MPHPIQAETLARSLRPLLRQADVDVAAFAQPLAPCQLQHCRATCCHDGVVLDPLERPALEEALQRHRVDERVQGFDIPESPFTTDASGRERTRVRPAANRELADDFPNHFPKTRCVFLDAAHRCFWQSLSIDLGLHPWAYKPLSCWMHPVKLQPPTEAGCPALLTLAGNPKDSSDFASCTPCGRRQVSGAPAREVLANELKALGAIAGRDFLAELGVDSANIVLSPPGSTGSRPD